MDSTNTQTGRRGAGVPGSVKEGHGSKPSVWRTDRRAARAFTLSRTVPSLGLSTSRRKSGTTTV
jgi:hypothetical protein